MKVRLAVTGVLLLMVLFVGATSSETGKPHGNLLRNPGFETGAGDRPLGWRPVALPGGRGEITFAWDHDTANEGASSVRISGDGTRRGIWSQNVPVTPETYYEICGYVAFADLHPQSAGYLQLVFRSASGRILEFVDLAAHRAGGREFSLDYPARMIIRAPVDASTAEVNGRLEGSGTIWFDDLKFAVAPTGTIAGRVSENGHPVAGARVSIWGDPWGGPIETVTDPLGAYQLTDVPVSHPRYIVIAECEGYRTLPAGDIDVIADGVTTVDFELETGTDPLDTLKVGYGAVLSTHIQPIYEMPESAPRPSSASAYPDAIQPYLGSDAYITTDVPALRTLATEILASVPGVDRENAVAVAWAVYSWISTNLNHDAVYGTNRAYRDVTSGIWQTIQPGGWCWGTSLYDWLYRPMELVEEGTGICIEHSWLSAALLRALNIPARARVGSAQFWLFTSETEGAWFGMSTNGGSNTFRETGRLGEGFGGSSMPSYVSAISEPFLQEDWAWDQPGLWREKHPWGETYAAGPTGLEMATRDLAIYAETGQAPEGSARRGPNRESVQIEYSQIELGLWNLGDQRIIDVRFPAPTDSVGATDTGEWAYWTNHPECVVETYVEDLGEQPSGITQRWRHIVFDVTGLLEAQP